MDDLTDGTRNKRGDWKPKGTIRFAPVLDWPFLPLRFAQWLVSIDGFFLPWTVTFAFMAFVIWRYLTPSAATTLHFSVAWIAYLLVRNALVAFAFYGAWHFRLNIHKAQGNTFKYDGKWRAARQQHFSLQQPEHRQPDLDRRRRDPDLDDVRESDAVGKLERVHALFQLVGASDLLHLDKWFGTFHDGTPEKQEAMNKRPAARAAKWSRAA